MVEYLYDNKYPTTRYQGSKRRYTDKLFHNLSQLNYDSVLDVFGGTGTMSYGFKRLGKQVTFNDILSSNYHVGPLLFSEER